MNKIIFTAFYTVNSGYEQEIKKLIACFEKFNLPYEIESVESYGDWQRNVKYKAILLRKMLDKHPDKSIVYLDSDSVIYQYPSLFAEIQADIGVHYIDWSKYRKSNSFELNGAVIYLANNQKTRELLDEWIKRNERDPQKWDQKILQKLLEDQKDRIAIFNLPPEYCKIFDLMRIVKNPVIEQFQASRRFKKEINRTGIQSQTRLDNPSVSIIMTVYNGERWVSQAIESCLAQTFKDIELIIVDDGSTDKTLEIVKSFKDSRVRIFTHTTNLGIGASKNIALKYCRGKYIARMDADDWDEPTRIEKSVARLESEPICDCVSCGMFWVTEGKMEKQMHSPNGMVPEIYMQGKGGGAPVNGSIVAKKEIYDIVGEWNEDLRIGCDSEWDVKAIIAGARWAYIPEFLYYYRRHPQQTIKTKSPQELRDAHINRLNQYRPLWESRKNAMRNIELYVTGACNMNCQFCSQEIFRKNYSHYYASIDLIKKLCNRAKAIGANYDMLSFTGGEPLLWPELETTSLLAKESGVFKKIGLLSNCLESDRLFKLLDSELIDYVHTTFYNSSKQIQDILNTKYKKQVTIDQLHYYKKLPETPIPDSLPAECNCSRFSIIENNIYPCGNFYAHVHRLGKSLEDYKNYFCTLDDDWISFFRKVDRFNMDLCQYCLGNRKVWAVTPIPGGN